MRLALACLLLASAWLAGCAAPRTVADVAYTAQEYSFTGPDQVTGDVVAIHLTNAGTQAHHLSLARIDAGHTMADFLAALAADNGSAIPAWSHWAGGAGPFMPGQSGDTVVLLTPGTYVMVCFVPDMQGVPHFMHGMAKQVVVTAPSGSPPAEPTADVHLSEAEFGFTFDHTPTAGHHTVRVDNKGGQVHEAVLAKLNPGATGQQFVAAFGPNATGPPPGMFVGGLPQQDPGSHGYFTADFTTGHYVLLCFVTDPATGAPHFAMGMMKEFDV